MYISIVVARTPTVRQPVVCRVGSRLGSFGLGKEVSMLRPLSAFRPRSQAFTLIELLVVIAIIAILIGILLPGLGQARKIGKSTEEQARLKDTSTGYLTYANDFKESFMPAYIHWAWSHAAGFGDPNYQKKVDMRGRDFEDRVIEGYGSKSWPWRFYSWIKPDMRMLVIDKNIFANFMARPGATSIGTDGPTGRPATDPSSTTREGAFAWHSAWGINGVYVGGHHMHGAFTSSSGYQGTSGPLGEFFVTRVSQVHFPTKLITMASSRRRDVALSGFGSSGDGAGTIIPGSYEILPPRVYPTGRLTPSVPGRGSPANAGGGWSSTSDKWDPKAAPSTWGYLDMRHFEKGAVATVDGHVEMLGLDKLRDSTRWANQASGPTWSHPPAR
jgi:prepilin-type N-terminal cleavage/methylation domain-containing protein